MNKPANGYQTNSKIPITLTIAGSDSSGGAGIQADLKTFSSLKTFGTSAITAITAQNSMEVSQIFELPSKLIFDQIKAVAEDFAVDAVKTGMLFSIGIIEIVAKAIKKFKLKNYVLDPVMVAKSGSILLKKEAIQLLKNELFPLADVITPNIPEAEMITGVKIHNEASIRKALDKLIKMGSKCVVIKGGHSEGEPDDWINFNGRVFALKGERINTKNTHGSGCTFSAAIASFLARGMGLEAAIREAKKFVHNSIYNSLDLGRGHGPLHHMHPWYEFK